MKMFCFMLQVKRLLVDSNWKIVREYFSYKIQEVYFIMRYTVKNS